MVSRLLREIGTPVLFVSAACLVLAACATGGGAPTPPPVAKLRPCDIAAESQLTGRSPPIVGGGTYTGTTIIINKPVQLKEGEPDLIVVARDDLDVNEDILFPKTMTKLHARSLNITLISLNGTVTIAPGVTIGSGKAAKGPSGSDATSAGFGVDGGHIKIYGATIFTRGKLVGNEGGDGGKHSFAGATLNLSRLGPQSAGDGGNAGRKTSDWYTVFTTASLFAGWPTRIHGADGGPDGTVLIYGKRNQPPKADVKLGAAAGGNGGSGGEIYARAFLPHAFLSPRTGENAYSIGGWGGIGGTVRFHQAEVTKKGSATAGDGGKGADAVAQGGDGEHDVTGFGAYDAGNGVASGGQGGHPGITPDIPEPQGKKSRGTAGRPGGGDALAMGGMGGNGIAGISSGGFSDSAMVYGGLNGAGVRPTPYGNWTRRFPPTGASGEIGGAGPSLTQRGVP